MKERVKTFVIEAAPTARSQEGKDLGSMIDRQVNEFISRDDVSNPQIVVSAELDAAYPKAIVVVKYVPVEVAPESVETTSETGDVSTEEPAKKRGRPPKSVVA